MWAVYVTENAQKKYNFAYLSVFCRKKNCSTNLFSLSPSFNLEVYYDLWVYNVPIVCHRLQRLPVFSNKISLQNYYQPKRIIICKH